MTIPTDVEGRLRLSSVSVSIPMFQASFLRLVVETCKGGVVSIFPALNALTAEASEQWLVEITAALAEYLDVINEHQAATKNYL